MVSAVDMKQVRAVLEREARALRKALAQRKVLFDLGTPAPLRRSLSAHSPDALVESGWSDIGNALGIRWT